MIVRPTSLLRYETCPRQYYYLEVLRLRPLVRSANLAFGGAYHQTVTDWLTRHVLDEPNPDIEAEFDKNWEAQTAKGALEFSSLLTPEMIPKVGKRLATQFRDRWDTFDLAVLFDQDGHPLVERRFEVDLGSGLILSTRPDTAVFTPKGSAAPLDLKTAAQPASELFYQKSDQLTAQQIALEAFAEPLMLPSVEAVGFCEMLKKPIPKTTQGSGPQVLEPKFVRARSKSEKKEYIEKVHFIADLISREKFPAQPRMAYNTPCDLCDVANYCQSGDTTGLTESKPTSQPLKQVA